MSDVQTHVDQLQQELRRGTLTIAALSQLHERQYGYSLVTILQKKGIQVEPGTLYPLLRRLEKRGLLKSEWDTTEARPRKYYKLSEVGKKVLIQLVKEWNDLTYNMQNLLK